VLEAVVLVALVTDHLHHLLLLAAGLLTLVGEDLKDDVEVVKRNTPGRARAVPSLHARSPPPLSPSATSVGLWSLSPNTSFP